MPSNASPLAALACLLILSACSTAPSQPPPPDLTQCPRPPAALLQPMPPHLPPMLMSGTGLRAPAISTQSAPPGLGR